MTAKSGVYLSVFFCATTFYKQIWQYVNSMLVVGWLGKRLWVWRHSMRRMSMRKRDGQM